MEKLNSDENNSLSRNYQENASKSQLYCEFMKAIYNELSQLKSYRNFLKIPKA